MNGQNKVRAFSRALLGTAQEAGLVDSVRSDALALIDQWDGSPELRAFCAAHRPESPADHASAVESLWGGTLTPCMINLIKQMAKWGCLSVLRQVAKTYLELSDIAQNRYFATIEFACPPADADILILKKKLVERYHHNVEIVHSVNPSLLAGFRMTVRDRITDASLSGRISRLRHLVKLA